MERGEEGETHGVILTMADDYRLAHRQEDKESNPIALVEFDGVCKAYTEGHMVVRNLDLQISRGEFLTLLGPSGSGKSTTLMMLAGFETPTAGVIRMSGQPMNNVPPHRRGMGVVFQDYALFPHMTVRENVAYPLKVRRRPRREINDRVDRILELVQLSDLAARRPNQLSGGQRQRVALSRALVFDPEVVLMDEPLGALDRQLREQMQLEIRRLHRHLRVTVVYVTHDQSEALTMSDRVAVFNQGQIQQVDTPKILYEAPTSSFVARFVGENNVLTGKIERMASDFCAVRLGSGQCVIARSIKAEGIGASTSVWIRPEKIRITGSCSSTFENSFCAEILETIYLGDHIRVRLRLSYNDELVVKLSGAVASDIRPGQKIKVEWAATNCIALDPI